MTWHPYTGVIVIMALHALRLLQLRWQERSAFLESICPTCGVTRAECLTSIASPPGLKLSDLAHPPDAREVEQILLSARAVTGRSGQGTPLALPIPRWG